MKNNHSMAAPHVAGLAALLISEHATWTDEEIRQASRRAAADVATTGFDLDTDYGRINAAKALANWPTAPPPALLASRWFPHSTVAPATHKLG